MSRIYLVRHGQSEANLKKLWGGDFSLTELGREQAKGVPERINVIPDKVVSSALARANETARIAYPEAEVEKNAAFNEIDFGTQNLKPIVDDKFWRMYLEDPENLQILIKGDNIRDRVIWALEEIEKLAKEYENVAIFTSDTLLRNIIAYMQGLKPVDTGKYFIANCQVVSLVYDGCLKIDDISAIKLRENGAVILRLTLPMIMIGIILLISRLYSLHNMHYVNL